MSAPPAYTSSLDEDTVTIDILLLGSPKCGKSTLLSRLIDLAVFLPSLRSGWALQNPQSIDLNKRPFDINVRQRYKSFVLRFWPNTSTLFTDLFPEIPHVVLLCYDITNKASLYNVQKYWRKMFVDHYPELQHDTPVMLLGLKRDRRSYDCVLPQEGLLAAQDMRADRYAECSALTGELFLEALEDITKMAVGTTTKEGGLSKADETGCVVL